MSRVRRLDPRPTVRVSGPAELVQAVPYLLNFHPRDSIVVIGLRSARLVVTARLDLEDAAVDGAMDHLIRALATGGATDVFVAVYDDVAFDPHGRDRPQPGVLAALDRACDDAGVEILDVVLVSGARWRSVRCADASCCPAGGLPLDAPPSSFALAATVAGRAPLPDRATLAATLEPLPESERARLGPALARFGEQYCAVATVADAERQRRRVVRELFAAARASDAITWSVPDEQTVARFGAALAHITVRDALWVGVDSGRVDGRPLWRELARRLPAPFDAPALFLYGWRAFRVGEGSMANVAAERAVRSDPSYTAADLLTAALVNGVDPRSLPRLRLPRPA